MKTLNEHYEMYETSVNEAIGLKTMKAFMSKNLKNGSFSKCEIDMSNFPKHEMIDKYKAGNTTMVVFRGKGDSGISVDFESPKKDVGFAVGNKIDDVMDVIKPYLK